MTLKRSLSQKLKRTITKTKRIVSPSIGSKRSSSTTPSTNELFTSPSESSLPTPNSNSFTDLIPLKSAGRHKKRDSRGLEAWEVEQLDHDTPTLNGLGISQLDSSNSIASLQNSISSIQNSANHLLSLAKPKSVVGTSINHSLDSSPTLLYTGRKRSGSIRRNTSLKKHSLEFIDTSNIITMGNSIPTPVSLKGESLYIDDYEMKPAEKTPNNDSAPTSNQIEHPNDIILLPTNPTDQSLPPCTTEELTPIIPTEQDRNALINSNYFDFKNLERPSNMLNSNWSSSTTNSCTINSSYENSIRYTSTTPSSSPLKHTNSIKSDNILFHEIVQSDCVNPIFTKSNQIDHLDKDLDIKKNDLLADQMALNILRNISEENVDELSKLREEISRKN